MAAALQAGAWPSEPTLVAATTKNNTYARLNKTTKKQEMIGYAGENASTWTNSQYIYKTKRADSLLGKDLYHLKEVCWMDPWARVERLPASVKSFDFYVYHVYEHDFYMPLQDDLRIMIARQDKMDPNEHCWDKSLEIVQ